MWTPVDTVEKRARCLRGRRASAKAGLQGAAFQLPPVVHRQGVKKVVCLPAGCEKNEVALLNSKCSATQFCLETVRNVRNSGDEGRCRG